MVRRVVVLAALALLAGAVPAAAGTSKSFSIPLPAPKTGTFVELVARGVPGKPAVTGDPFTITIGNLSSLPSYIRAAAAVVRAKPLEYDIFIAINAPEGLVHARRLAVADALDLIIASASQAFPTGNIDLHSGDGCAAFYITHAYGGSPVVTLGPWQSTGNAIFGFTKAADKHCK
ncbi:MAG: hypothetical protein JOY73_01670 [Actinobacteria bacterium]|nr:hypothetical protein [Actinomycetota bacterium]